MVQFFYKAKNQKGLVSRGVLDAASEREVYQTLKKKGLLLLSTRAVSKNWFKFELSFLERVTLIDRINFTKQIAVMIKSGLPIIDALETIQDQTSKKKIRSLIGRIIQSVKAGSTLSAALSKEPEFFSELYIAVIESGEKSGQLQEVFERIGNNLEKDHEVNSKVKGALYYPTFILIVMAIVMFIIFSYVLPQLKTIFKDVGVPLPIMTKVLLAIGDFFSTYQYFIIAGAFGFVIGMKFAVKTKWFQLFWDVVQLKIPIFGKFFQLVYDERFSRTLSSLVTAGLPMLEILKTCRRVMVNHLYQQTIDQIIAQVESGVPLSTALKNQRRFPKLIGNMVAIGEKTGSIGKIVTELSEYYQREIDQMAKNFTTLIEPVIMVVVGIGVGFMVASVILPIYNLISSA